MCSEWLEVLPERASVAIPLVSTVAPEVESISADANAAVITLDQYMDPETVFGFKQVSADGGEVAYGLICDKS